MKGRSLGQVFDEKVLLTGKKSNSFLLTVESQTNNNNNDNKVSLI